MTREEAIKRIEDIKRNYERMVEIITDNEAEALNMAIEALKQEPNEDCISREQALDPYKILEVTDTLSVYTIRQNLAELPSVTPTRPTGHWIVDVDKWGDIVTTVNGYRCDKCNTFNTDKDNYCPNCGYRMVGDDNADSD